MPLHLFDFRCLLVRQHFGEDGVDAEVSRNRVCDRLRVARHHDHFDMLLVEALNRFARFVANRICNREHGQRRRPVDHRDRRLSARSGTIDGGLEHWRNLHIDLAQQCRTAEEQLPSVHDGLDAAPGNRLKRVGARDREPTLLCALDDALRDRVFRIVFDGRCQRECILLSEAVGRGDLHDPKLAAGQRSGLIEEHGCHIARLLEPAAVAYEKPALSA